MPAAARSTSCSRRARVKTRRRVEVDVESAPVDGVLAQAPTYANAEQVKTANVIAIATDHDHMKDEKFREAEQGRRDCDEEHRRRDSRVLHRRATEALRLEAPRHATERVTLRVLGCDHKCLGESPPRSEAFACVLPAKLHDGGPKL